MANLLSWAGPLGRKKNENLLGGGGFTFRDPIKTGQSLLSQINAFKNSRISQASRPTSSSNNRSNFFQQSNNFQQNDFQQQANEQARIQAEQQRRQQEEEQRRQRIEQMRQEQEKRRQEEQAKRAQQQKAEQQKQRRLLNSSFNSENRFNNSRFGDRRAGLQNNGDNNNFTNFRNNLETQRQNQIRRQQEIAAQKEADLKQNPWKKYYDEEKQKVRDQSFNSNRLDATLQDMFNSGWDRRLAETNARNRYASELNRQAFDEKGNIADKFALAKAKQVTNENLNVARNYGEQERASSRALGASYDSDYKDNPFLATFNAVRRMDVGNAMTGGAEGGGAEVGKFLLNLLPGMASAPISGTINASEAIASRGLDESTGRLRNLTGTERLGRAASGAIDAAGVFFGGSGDMLNAVGKSIFKKGASEVTKQAIKKTTTGVIKDYLKAMFEEGAEEGVQQAFEFFGNGGKLVTKDGQFDADSFKQMLEESGQAAALGAIGGGIFHAGGQAIDTARGRMSNKASSNINNRLLRTPQTNVDLNTNQNIDEDNLNNETNVAQNTEVNTQNGTNVSNTNINQPQVKTNIDGSIVKQNADGSTSRLSNSELSNVITRESTQTNGVSGLNPFETNRFNAKSSNEDINALTRRAEQGDTYARRRLAELTGVDQEENTDWRGKNVDEVINPENETNIADENTQNETTLNEERRIDRDENQNALQNASNELDSRTFDELTPTEQVEWLNTNSDQAASEMQLAQALRQMGIDPTGMSRLDMMREYSKALKNTTPEVKTENEIENNRQEVLPSERDIARDQEAEEKSLLETLSQLYGPMEKTTSSPQYDENTSVQKIEDVLDGKTSFNDYIGDQRELLWQSFKNSNRGTETFYHRDEYGNIDGRDTVSNNGTLYRQLYDEYGGKPTKAEFNEALDDVLSKGQDSVYYDGFREFDHDGEQSAFGFNQGNENIDAILDLQSDVASSQSPLANIVANSTGNENTDQLSRIKEDVAKLGQMLAGQSQLQPAYVGIDNNFAGTDNVRLTDLDTTKNYSTYQGEDGKIAIKIDDPTLLKGTPIEKYESTIRKAIQEKFQGQFLKVGDTDYKALVSKRTAGKISRRGGAVNDDIAYRNKGEASQQLDELVNNLHNVRVEPNNSAKLNKQGIKSVTKGEIEIDINGQKLYPTVVIRNYKDGTSVVHEISDIKRTTIGSNEPVRRDNFRKNSGSQSPNSPIVAQNPENVNAKSSFAENTSANNNFSEETRQALKNDPLGYKPTTNEERLARANKILSTKSSDEIDTYLRDNFFNVKPKNADSADMVLAGEYAKMLDAKGQYDRSTELINKMSEIGTKQGQNIQAMSLMMNRSPEGIANMAQTAIKKGGGKMDGELRQQIVSKTQEIGRTRGERAKLNEENAKISEQIMNGQGDLKALRKRQMEIARAYRLDLAQEGRQFSQLSDLVSKNSPDTRSIFGSIWRAGLLSGPRTHTGNAVSNTFQNILNAGADRFASGLDWARSKVTGTERQIVSSAGGRKEGLRQGLGAAKEVMKTGNNLWEGIDTVIGESNMWGKNGEMEFKNKIANAMVAKPTNFVFRAMSAGDLPFRYAAFENAIRTEAKRQGVNQGLKGQALNDYVNSRVATPDPELQAFGMRKGNESVYDADTILSKAMGAIDRVINSQENKVVRNSLKTAETLVTPFVKVPSKVLSTAMDYSPLGSVKAIVRKIGTKGYTTADFETDLAKSGLGTTGLVGLGYALSAAGVLTGAYPTDNDERNRWKAEGIEPNSIKIGDKYLSLNYLGPASILMSMGSGVQQRQAKGEDAVSIASGTLMDTLNTFLDQSYVQGLSNAVNAITDSQRYGESYANSFARGLVPNLLRQTATATDPKQRQTDNVGEAILSGIPGLSQTLNAKVDTYGREIENKQTLPLGQMWDAFKLSNSRETNNVIDEVNRLHSVDPNDSALQVTPPSQQKNISVDGTNVRLTGSQRAQLQKDTGVAALEAMSKVIQSSQYAGLSDAEKAAALDKATKDAQKQARKQFIEANNIKADNNHGTNNSGGNTTGDYTGKAISSALSKDTGKNAIAMLDSLSQESKDILTKYNSMTKEDWNKYIKGSSADSSAAEYRLAKAKYESDLANGKLNEAQKIKREKELAKLEVSQKWEKKYRDAYSLAGTKTDMQTYLNKLDEKTRAQTVAVLNGLNNAMLEAGVIKSSTYKTRANAINNSSSRRKSSGRRRKSSGSRSGSSSKSTTEEKVMSSAEASALSGLAKTLVKNTNRTKSSSNLGAKAPETKRKMSKTKSGGNKTGLATYTPSGAKTISVTKGAKRSIV